MDHNHYPTSIGQNAISTTRRPLRMEYSSGFNDRWRFPRKAGVTQAQYNQTTRPKQLRDRHVSIRMRQVTNLCNRKSAIFGCRFLEAPELSDDYPDSGVEQHFVQFWSDLRLCGSRTIGCEYLVSVCLVGNSGEMWVGLAARLGSRWALPSVYAPSMSGQFWLVVV